MLTRRPPCLVSDHHGAAREAVQVVQVAAEVDEAGAEDGPHPGLVGDDSGGGVVAEHDGGLGLLPGLGQAGGNMSGPGC